MLISDPADGSASSARTSEADKDTGRLIRENEMLANSVQFVIVVIGMQQQCPSCQRHHPCRPSASDHYEITNAAEYADRPSSFCKC